MAFSDIFKKLMNVPDDVLELASLYLKIYFLGSPGSMVYNFGASILRATGDTKRPFYFLAVSGLSLHDVSFGLFKTESKSRNTVCYKVDKKKVNRLENNEVKKSCNEN